MSRSFSIVAQLRIPALCWLACLAPASLSAQLSSRWTGAAGTTDVNDPANWTNAVPTALVQALFGTPGSLSLDLSGSSGLQMKSSFFRDGNWRVAGGLWSCSDPQGAALQIGLGQPAPVQVTLSDGWLGTRLQCAGGLVLGMDSGSEGRLVVEDSARVDLDAGAQGTGRLVVGLKGRGELELRGAGQLQADAQLVLGEEFGGAGGRLWVHESGSWVQAQQVQVGLGCAGELRVESGAQVQSISGLSAAISSAGVDQGSATLIVSGPGSQLDLSLDGSSSVIGSLGIADVQVSQGARVSSCGPVLLGTGAGSVVDLKLSNTGSTWQQLQGPLACADLIVGAGGVASVEVSDGAALSLEGSLRLGTQAGSVASLTLGGASTRLSAQAMSLDGGSLLPSGAALLRVESGARLQLSGDGRLGAGGRLELQDASLGAQRLIVEAGAQLSGHGTLAADVQLDGRLEHGLQSGTLSCQGDLVLSASARIELHLDGFLDPALPSGLSVAGELRLGGELAPVIPLGVSLQPGDLLEWATCANIRGRLARIVTPIQLLNRGLELRVVYRSDGLALRVEPLLTRSLRVLLGEANLPLAGVRVLGLDPEDASAAPRLLGLTDANGFADLSRLDSRLYRIAAELDYLEPASGELVSVRNYPGASPERSFVLSADSLPLPDVRFPDPVVLQAGLGGASASWDALRGYLGSDPLGRATPSERALPAFLCFPMPSNGPQDGWQPGGYDNSGDELFDHTQNAQRLEAWIQGRLAPEWAQWLPSGAQPQPLFVAHSMGALILRAYLNGVRSSPGQLRVVALDGIHGGSSNALTRFKPNLGQGPLNGFCDAPGSAPTGLAQLGWNQSRRNEDAQARWLLLAAVDDPIIDPFPSALGFGEFALQGSNQGSGSGVQWIAGSELEVSGVSHQSILWDATVLRQVASYLSLGDDDGVQLDGDLPRAAGLLEASLGRPAGANAPEPGLAALWAQELVVPAGATGRLRVPVVAAERLGLALLLSGAGASYALRRPDGSSQALESPSRCQLAQDLHLEEFWIEPQQDGTLWLELLAGPLEQARLELHCAGEGGLALQVECDLLDVQEGQPLALRAYFLSSDGRRGLDGATTIAARLDSKAGADLQIELYDDGLHADDAAGDGVYGASFVPLGPGPFELRVSGWGDQAGASLLRSQDLGLSVQSNRASLVGRVRSSTPDVEQDGALDALLLSQDILVRRAGIYRLSLAVVSNTGRRLWSGGKTLSAGPGLQSVSLRIPGEQLSELAQDGPWRLEEIYLEDVQRSQVIQQGADRLTPAFLAADFQAPRAPLLYAGAPSTGSARGGERLALTGRGLASATAVWVGDQRAEILFASDALLGVRLPVRKAYAASLAGGSSGSASLVAYEVRVQTPYGEASIQDGFSY